MSTRLNLRPDELQLVRSILAAHVPSNEVLVFGSRVAGKAKPASDLDLCIIDIPPLPPDALRRLHDAFTESTLPFKVDLSVYSDLSDDFRQLVEQSAIRLNTAIEAG